MPRKLNLKQESFIQFYVISKNATQAYLKAYKCTEFTAKTNGPKLLENTGIKKQIAEHLEVIAEELNISAKRVVQELANVAFGHLGLVCVQDKDTGLLKLKQFDDMDGNHISLIAAVQVIETHSKDGDVLGVRTNFKMHDKLKALELLSKHLGLLDGDKPTDSNTEDADRRLLEHVGKFRTRRRLGSRT